MTIGTSCAARVMVKMPVTNPTTNHLKHSSNEDAARTKVPPRGLWCYRADSQHVLIGGALTDGGALMEWLKELVGEERFLAAAAEVEREVLGCNTALLRTFPTSLPFWSGERCPGWHSLASGTMTGITRGTGPAALLYSLQEAVALRLRLVIAELDGVGRSTDGSTSRSGIRCIVGSGKAMARSASWRQILADATGFPVVRLSLAGVSTISRIL